MDYSHDKPLTAEQDFANHYICPDCGRDCDDTLQIACRSCANMRPHNSLAARERLEQDTYIHGLDIAAARARA